MEGAPKPVTVETDKSESLDAWRTLCIEAPQQAEAILVDRGLMVDIEQADTAALESIVATLPAVLEQLRSDNQQRYVERELRSHLAVAEKKLAYLHALAHVA